MNGLLGDQSYFWDHFFLMDYFYSLETDHNVAIDII